jgi:hypothetical protein
MNIVSKAVALAFLAASAALMTLSSQAQTARQQGYTIYPRPTPTPKCCALAVRPFGTNAVTWTVTTPSNNFPVPASTVTPTPSWAPALPGSQWISNVGNAGTYPGVAPGQYVYRYHFCLCELPQGSSGPVPAVLSLKVLSDNQFTAWLNGNQIGQNLATDTTPFMYPTSIPNVVSFFQVGDNELKFIVTNLPFGQENTGWQSGRHAAPHPVQSQAAQAQAAAPGGNNPSGLDVAGTISGYFLDLPPTQHCPRVPPRPNSQR